MKCSNPNCDKQIGLYAYKLSSLGNLRFHSKECREAFREIRNEQLADRRMAKLSKWLVWLRLVPP